MPVAVAGNTRGRRVRNRVNELLTRAIEFGRDGPLHIGPMTIGDKRSRIVTLCLRLLLVGFLLSGCAALEPERARRADLAQMVSTSTQIFVERPGGVRRSGSGVILATDLAQGGTAILTAAHLLEPVVEQSVVVVAGRQRGRIPAQIIAIDGDRDLALLTARLSGVTQIDLAARATLTDDILIVAYPWGRQRTVVRGAVSQIAPPAVAADPLAIAGPVGLVDATVSYGMSGGGVYNEQSGQLVGLVRGYRTANLSLSSDEPPLKLPIAGETTIISTRDIVCFLLDFGYEGLIAKGAAGIVSERDCPQPKG